MKLRKFMRKWLALMLAWGLAQSACFAGTVVRSAKRAEKRLVKALGDEVPTPIGRGSVVLRGGGVEDAADLAVSRSRVKIFDGSGRLISEGGKEVWDRFPMELRKALDELVSDALKEVTPEEVLSEDTLRKLLLDTLKKQSAFKYSFDLDGDFEVVYSATRGKIKLRFDILKTVKRAVLIAGGAGGVYISSANKEGRERLSKVLAKIACELYPEAYYCDFLWVPAS